MENKNLVGMAYIGTFLMLQTLGVFDAVRAMILGG